MGLDVISFSISMSLLFFLFIGFQQQKKKQPKKKLGEKMRNFYFLLLKAFQILYMLLPDISIHCALIEYTYI
jgi:hypothetical protein